MQDINLKPIETSPPSDGLGPEILTTPCTASLSSSGPATPVSTIQAQHMTERIYEQMMEKQKKLKVVAICLFVFATLCLIFGLISIVLGIRGKVRVWAVAIGTFSILLSLSLTFGGLCVVWKFIKLRQETTNFASSENVEKSSTHTYTHFQIVSPSPMVLRNILAAVKNSKSPSRWQADNDSTGTHRVSVGDFNRASFKEQQFQRNSQDVETPSPCVSDDDALPLGDMSNDMHDTVSKISSVESNDSITT
ncbi:uncharacterized protein LOC144344817 [Saccoglossus kowalevskii]